MQLVERVRVQVEADFAADKAGITLTVAEHPVAFLGKRIGAGGRSEAARENVVVDAVAEQVGRETNMLGDEAQAAIELYAGFGLQIRLPNFVVDRAFVLAVEHNSKA